MLPCRHIFKVRKELHLSLFCKEPCAERWTKDYYRRTQRLFTTTHSETQEIYKQVIINEAISLSEIEEDDSDGCVGNPFVLLRISKPLNSLKQNR